MFSDYLKYDLTSPSGLVWKASPSRKIRVGSFADNYHKSTGYFRVRLLGTLYYSHRVIWELINGPISEGMSIDHIDGNRANNDIDNLRLVTVSQNNKNTSKRVGTVSKFKGVCWHRQCKKWKAEISCDKQRFHIGLFESEESAAKAYNVEAVKLFGEFAKLNHF